MTAKQQKHEEPACLIKMGLKNEADGSAIMVPHTVVVGGCNAKAVFSGREIVVVGDPPGPRVDPIAIVALQLIFEAHPFGNQEAQRGVMELDLVLSRCNLQIIAQDNRAIVYQHAFNHHGRRQGVG